MPHFLSLGSRRRAAVVISAVSVVIQAVGAAIDYLAWRYHVLGGPPTRRSVDMYYLNPAKSPILGEFGELSRRVNWASGCIKPGIKGRALIALTNAFLVGAGGLAVSLRSDSGPPPPGGLPSDLGAARAGVLE